MKFVSYDNINKFTEDVMDILAQHEIQNNMRQADHKELYYLPYWSMGFDLDCGFHDVDLSGSTEKVKKFLDDRTLYIWEDGIPVSQAATGRKTLNGAVVNAVYTPPYYRGKGYASSCVASLSKQLLESGYKFCCLFTDRNNPVSNGIYMKIGYKPVGDYDEYKFSERQRQNAGEGLK